MNFPKHAGAWLSLPEAAKALEMSEYQLRQAIERGEIRSKRSSKAARARILFREEWLTEYRAYRESPTLLQRLKVWVREHIH